MGNSPWGDGTFRFFSHPKKKHAEWPKRFRAPASFSRQPDSVSLRPKNRQWTFNPAHHSPLWNFQDSIEQPSPRPSLLRYSSLSLPPRRSSPSAFLTKPFGIMESLAEGRIVPLNSRPCIFIFRCRMVEKKQEKSPACEFFHFSLRQPTFLLENFCISINFIEYHECITRLEIKPLEICKFLTLKAVTVCKTTIFVAC